MGLMSQPVRRVEDGRFITGRGRYVADIRPDGAAIGFVLRSPYAHAMIRSIDIAAALEAPGVLGVITGADLEAAGIGHIGSPIPPRMLSNRDGTARVDGDQPLMALDRVRYVGDPIAFIVARSAAEAKDAADLIMVDYDELPAVASLAEATTPDAPAIWPEAPDNVSVDWEVGDAAATEAAFARAAHIVRLDLANARIVVNPMETRGAIGAYDAASDSYELTVSSQGSHPLRDAIAKRILKIDPDRLRVVTPDVGGGFGLKMSPFPEYVLVLFAARRFGVPVKWVSERTEAFQSDSHGRDLQSHAELALDADGQILGFRGQTDFNLGCHGKGYGAGIQTVFPQGVIGGTYKIPVIHYRARGIFTNTVPVEAYRGAGRPEHAYIIERLMDRAARELGIGQDEIRLRNFILPQDMPYANLTGAVLDSGDFPRNLGDCMAAAGWADFPARRAEAAARDRLRGIGMAYYMERTIAGIPSDIGLFFEAGGRVRLSVGTSSHGQGHETSFAQIVADRLGVPMDQIDFEQGDTHKGVNGAGTGGSRSLWVSGNGILEACGSVVEKGRAVVADWLGVPADSVAFEEGAFRVGGSNRFVPLIEAAGLARDHSRISPDLASQLPEGLDSRASYAGDKSTYPNGCHICEVEIDPETGQVSVVAYHVVDDFGFVLNPMIVEGQVHGGVAQGIGEALLEHCLYEPGSAQLISGSFMDYCMPRADDLPAVGFATNEVLCTTNPLGIKGCGEAGTVGAVPATLNAVLDALWDHGVRDVDMPMTPLRVWEALRKAR